MSLSGNEDDIKKTDVRPEPLCLFCFPEDTSFVERKTYVNTLPRKTDSRKAEGKDQSRKAEEKDKEREEFWLRKRTEDRIRRRRMKEPIRNLKSYLLTFVKNEKVAPKAQLPSLCEVLETVKDAWSSPPPRNFTFLRQLDKHKGESPKKTSNQLKMKDEQVHLQFSPQLPNRRLSMPEELMRKYCVSKDKTSEDSETNKTTIDVSPSSSSTIETARRQETVRVQPNLEDSKTEPQKKEATKTDAYQQTSDSEDGKSRNSDLPKRVTQNDYYKQGKRIIKVKAIDKGSCTCSCIGGRESSTTASAKEETDESGTTESLPSSSPIQLPRRESSSGNLSSESDYIRCTCAELSSKETSTDLYFSGKSTLSQTVSDKSISTQDSTVSINSVSTRGSTVSDISNSTTPEIERTSAKETTTSPDYSPRVPKNRKNRRRDKQLGHSHDHSVTCPRYNESKHSRNCFSVSNSKGCPIHSKNSPKRSKITANASTNTEQDSAIQTIQTKELPNEVAENNLNKEIKKALSTETDEKTEYKPPEEQYKWAKLSQEELYMMQQLRHRKFVESQKKIFNPLPTTPDTDSMTSCGTGSNYKETECSDRPILIPRYSALPRTLSMLVNTSSPDTSQNSDSDNQSLPDSLEDQPITHVHKLYFDTKKESKPVRGDASIVQDNKLKHRQPRGRAFFVSIKEPFGEDEMLENIEKIPQPPEKIKNQIFERHLNLCTKHKHLHGPEEQKGKSEGIQKKKKSKTKSEKNGKTQRDKKNTQEESDRKGLLKITKRIENQKLKEESPSQAGTKQRKETKGSKGQFNSKIPVLVSSRSMSSSPERDSEAKEKPERPKTRLRREKEKEESEKVENNVKQTAVETTQILEITHAGAELSLQKPQAVIHPSQMPFESKAEPQLTMPPLITAGKIPPFFRHTWNKQLLAPVRRSPIGKFRQRFEVIPEEKSSSLSSAEEKNGRDAVSKFTDASTSTLPSEKIQFHSYNLNEVSNLIVAKITNQQLETLPFGKDNDSQKIILFSSKPQKCNSTKGRDALIAMNREDFSRLARGWMNFYKLSENEDNSESEGTTKEKGSGTSDGNKRRNPKSPEKLKSESNHVTSNQKENSCLSEDKKVQEVPELNDNIRFDCSNTILRAVKSIPPIDSNRSLRKQNSLSELKLSNQKCGETKSTVSGSLPRVRKHVEYDDTDSDSTDYMEPPSPRVPPLPIDDIPSDATLSSSDSDVNVSETTQQSLKYSQFKTRGATNRTRMKKENSFETFRLGRKKNPGWSVTVAGTVELSRSAPDLEMRLSFPASEGPPLVSQSDSGFAEDSNYSKLSESLQDLESYTSRKELPLGSGNSKQKWLVTVKNPKQETSGVEQLGRLGKDGENQKFSQKFQNNSNHLLPDLEPLRSRNPKKVLKDVEVEEKIKRLVERKMRAIWPKVQRVFRKEFLTERGRLITELEGHLVEESCLSVRGSAVSLERKQKPPTMTERDLTRRYTSRDNE